MRDPTDGAMPTTDLRSGTQVGAYLLGRVLGRGSMAIVYEATHEAIGRRVAIKIIDPRSCPAPQALQRFLNEARLVNEIAHPGIVEIYDHLLLPDGAAALVMELLRGETLGARLRRRKSLAVPEAVRIARQIAAASAAVHQRGYAHRDLKPDNVMLIPDAEAQGRERTKVLDFGVARILPGMPDGEWQVQTHAGLMLGTPQYMAPEQCQGTAAIDERVDCYALGVMLYQMLSGEPPFIAAGLGELFAKHLYLEPAPLLERASAVPPVLATLTHALLRKKSEERPSMREVVVTLEGIAGLKPDHLVLSPGPCSPAEAGICVDAIKAFTGKLPILGVCLGHQAIGHAYGAAIRRAPRPMHGRLSALHHDGSPLFSEIPQGFRVVRYHSLVVATPLPPPLRAHAWSDDECLMALSHATLPRWGVQFHPESIGSPHGPTLLRNFLALCTAAR